MRIRSLHLRNFRGIAALDLPYPSGVQSVVLVGVNGSGKTAILDATAILLSRLEAQIRSAKGRGRHFSGEDIQLGSSSTKNALAIDWNGSSASWTGSRVNGKPLSLFESPLPSLPGLELGVTPLASKIRQHLEADEDYNIPLMVYYPVNRAVLDIPLRIRKKHQFDQATAYSQALEGGSASFRIFFEWFRQREDLENERLRDDSTFRDRQLEAVRTAVNALIPGFEQLRVRRQSPVRMTVRKEGQEITIQQLSDGEKCLLAMTGDLARRLAIANPSLDEPLQGTGIVLIDEIELHLHPVWQRAVIPALERTFPNCQFLISTHSAAVLGHVQPEAVVLLDRGTDGVVAHQLTTLGQDANRILEEVFGVPARPQEFEDRLHELFRLIDEGDLATARHLAASLEEDLGADEPELTKASAFIRRKEILGK
jgi:predicted ATP-binding protein involved in virulence